MNDAKAIKKHAAQHDLFNRLHSIAADERFVRKVAEKWFGNRFQVIANQRCGSWYCDPSTSSKAYAYFKSTDGHTNNWNFNLRRSNLTLAEFAERSGGFILVDSTRRGKRMPDGLSKTVPIWCCVINRALKRRWLAEGRVIPESWDTSAYLPGQIVSPSERAQIEDRIDGWVEVLEDSVLPLPQLTKPLRPFFIHPATTVPPEIAPSSPYTPVICVSASRWVNDTGRGDVLPTATQLGDGFFSRTVAFDYVPGAGDDDELWGRGLTASLFYSHKKDLLSTPRDELPGLVDDLVADKAALPSIGDLSISTEKLDGGLPEHTGATSLGKGLYLDLGTPCQPTPKSSPSNPSLLTLAVVEVNKALKNIPFVLSASSSSSSPSFIVALPAARSQPKEYLNALSAVRDHLAHFSSLGGDMDLLLTPGRKCDLEAAVEWFRAGNKPEESPGIAMPPADMLSDSEMQSARKTMLPLAIVLLCSIPALSQDGTEEREIDKAVIADHLHHLVSLWPNGNPPRAALKRINEFLMSDDRSS